MAKRARPDATPPAAAHPRSVCPVACTLDLLGDKWTLLVIRDLFVGKTQFKDFLASPEGIATNILAARLKRLTEHGLVTREATAGPGRSAAYRLTPRGESLRPLLEAITTWGLTHIPGTAAHLRPT